MGKWESGKMGKWESEKMGKWGSGKILNKKSKIRNQK